MTKNILLISAFLMTALSISAQSEVGKVSIYPRIGINRSNITNNSLYTSAAEDASSINSKRKTGLVIGAEMEYQWSKGVSYSGGLMYSIQGYRYDDLEVSHTPKEVFKNYKEHMHYIIMPLMINLYVYKNLAIKGGLQLGYLISTYSKYEDVTETSTQRYNSNGMIYNKLDLSIPVGISYKYQKVVLDLRYDVGLTNTNKYASWKSKNNVIMMTIGYKIKI